MKKPGEDGGTFQTGNSMMAAIMSKRNQMKKVGGGVGGASVKPNPVSSGPKPPARPSGSGAGLPKPPVGGSTGFPKPATNTAPKPMGGGPKPMGGTQKPTISAPKPMGGAPKPVNNWRSKTPYENGRGRRSRRRRICC